MKLSAAVFISSILASAVPGAIAVGDLGAVRACVSENAAQKSAVFRMTIASNGEGLEVTETRFKLYWRRLQDGERRLLIRFIEPADLEGASVLVEGVGEARPRVHLFLPDIGKPQRVTSREQLMGFLGQADLGLDEIGILLDPVGGEDVRLLGGENRVAGRPVWLIESLRSGEQPELASRTRTFVDHEYCVPLRAEFYHGTATQPLLMDADPARVEREAHAWIPRELVFRNAESGRVTTLHVDEVEVDIPLAPGLLTVQSMTTAGGI